MATPWGANSFGSYSNALNAQAKNSAPNIAALQAQMQAQQAMLKQQAMSRLNGYVTMQQMLDEQVAPQPPALPVSTKFGEFIGHRMWKLHRGHLRSVYWNYLWMPGKVAGLVDGQKIEDYGNPGIHAFKDKAELLLHSGYDGDNLVFGTVKLWGDVIEYERGYHAEFASIVSLDHVELVDRPEDAARTLYELRHMYGVMPQGPNSILFGEAE